MNSSANGIKPNHARAEKMMELAFWYGPKPTRSEDLNLGSGEWTYNIPVYEERFGKEALMKSVGSRAYRL